MAKVSYILDKIVERDNLDSLTILAAVAFIVPPYRVTEEQRTYIANSSIEFLEELANV